MKSKFLLIGLMLTVMAALACSTEPQSAPNKASQSSTASPQMNNAREVAKTLPAPSHDAAAANGGRMEMHDHGTVGVNDVPAFEINPASLKNLPPTLAPEMFGGQQGIAYRMAREIPQTLAQLPCYCHCDKGFGHKSLHSCYVDDHAAHCAVCTDEAILAYRLQKEQHLKPEQIRERIIAQYSSQL